MNDALTPRGSEQPNCERRCGPARHGARTGQLSRQSSSWRGVQCPTLLRLLPLPPGRAGSENDFRAMPSARAVVLRTEPQKRLRPAGAIKLPYYHGSAAGEAPTREAHQTINGDALFARGLVRVPPAWGWLVQPYVFGGAARVHVKSRETAHCDSCVGSPGFVGADADFTAPIASHVTRPYVGIGAEVPLYGPLSARAEIGYIPGAVQSFWTGTRNYTLGSIALQVRF